MLEVSSAAKLLPLAAISDLIATSVMKLIILVILIKRA